MKLGDGLFLNTFRRVAEEYKSSGIAYNDMIVDNTYASGNIPLVFALTASQIVPCNWLLGPNNSTSWSCLTSTVPSFPTSVPPSSVGLASSQGATSDLYVQTPTSVILALKFNGTPQEYALFEPGCRHVASDIMGTNRANPAAMILSATMLLRHLG
jgi:isocitrate dehydrogenase (NAD+)